MNEDVEHRLACFRQDFFESDDEFDILFKRALFNEVLKTRKLDENEIDLTAKEILTSRSFKVPAPFGNKDLTIKIKKSKTESRLDHLTLKISELITKSNADKVVTLDESLEKGLQRLNGGIAGIVGNILVSDENTKLMKLTDNGESLEELSNRLFIKLQKKIENLHAYKFDVNVKKFPKLSFKRNEDDVDLAKDFLKKLLFFTNQADEKGVEIFLKKEIEDRQCDTVDNVRVTADAIFLQYHDLIQRWWMLKTASYLTKESNHYEEALAAIVDKPLLTIISKMYMIKIQNNADYTFNDKTLNSLKLTDQPPATIFVTESSALTVAKMIQSLRKTNHYVFDLEYVLDLPKKDFNTVCAEIAEINKLNKPDQINLIIIVCNNKKTNWFKRLESIAKVLKNKRTIFVLKESLVETIQNYFETNNILTDEKCNLGQMSAKSQKTILESTNVMFQDVEVSLDSIIDKPAMALVEGEVLNKIMNNEPIVLGKSNSNSNYEKVKHLYIDRRAVPYGPIVRAEWLNLSRHLYLRINGGSGKILQTLNDIAKEALITATPGMGKSTLLTHLSLKTKELQPMVWIVRINLLNYSEKFSMWQEKKRKIDYLETLKFFCEVLTEKQNKAIDLSIELEEENGHVTLKSCKCDQLTVFELKMFLDYCNRKELIFLFDGFDEICPMYTDEVLTFLKVVRKYPGKHKMCITSRSYDHIISMLKQEFENLYELQNFSQHERNQFLINFWKSKIKLRNLSNEQCNNVCSFMEFMTVHEKTFAENKNVPQVLFMNVCLNFLSYLREEIDACPESVVKTFNRLFSICSHKEKHFVEDFDTPLHLYLFAEHFQNQIKEESPLSNRWNLDINAFTVYDTFIETKLKLRFQEKNKIDLYNPDNKIIYENVRAEFFAKHYKLGAYAVFHQDADRIFGEKELDEIKYTINKINEGTEKTGLVHSVANGIPQFIHMTFTEYFAVQYICDLLKTATTEDKQKSIWDTILNIMLKRRENVRNILGYKIKTDENLRAIVKERKQMIHDLLLAHGKKYFPCYPDDFSNYLNYEIETTLREAMNDELMNFAVLLYNLMEKFSNGAGLEPESNTHEMVRKKYAEFTTKCGSKWMPWDDHSDDDSDDDAGNSTDSAPPKLSKTMELFYALSKQ